MQNEGCKFVPFSSGGWESANRTGLVRVCRTAVVQVVAAALAVSPQSHWHPVDATALTLRCKQYCAVSPSLSTCIPSLSVNPIFNLEVRTVLYAGVYDTYCTVLYA
jgi:hypothetical protein